MQWLEHGGLSMSLSAVRFRIQLGAGLSEKYICFSPLNVGILFRCCARGLGTLPSHVSLDRCE